MANQTANAGPRVLFVIHQIGSGADGGIRSITEMIRAVPALDKLVITNIESGVTDALRAVSPVKIWDMAEASYSNRQSRWRYRLSQVFARLGNNWEAFKTVRAQKADVVHANDLRSFWNTIFGAKLAGARVILNVRDTMRPGGNLRQWRAALGLCDLFLVLSREMVEMWRRDLEPTSGRRRNRDKFRFLYSIVDRARYSPIGEAERAALRDRLGIDPQGPAMVYVGRFEEKKAQLPFIENSLAELARLQPMLTTYFVGDFEPDRDSYAAACKAAVERLGLVERIRFMGYSARPEDWYRAADIVALASGREGLPRCMLETLACGGVFVTFDICSAREILEGHDCGVVISQGEYEAFAQACSALTTDDERRSHFCVNGPETVASLFDSDTNGAAYMSLLSDIRRESSGNCANAI